MLDYTFYRSIFDSYCATGSEGLRASIVRLLVLGVGMGIEPVAGIMAKEHLGCTLSDTLREGEGDASRSIFLVVTASGTRNKLLSEAIAFHAAQYEIWQGRRIVREEGVRPEVRFHYAEDGSSVTSRTTMYANGGIGVISARPLCADLLHRRISPNVVKGVLFVVQGLLSSDDIDTLGFAYELMSSTKRSLPLPFHVISDTVVPLAERSAVFKALNVSDLVIYPRFRREVLHHFEDKVPTLKIEEQRVRGDVKTREVLTLLLKIMQQVVDEVRSLRGDDGDSVDVTVPRRRGHINRSAQDIDIPGDKKALKRSRSDAVESRDAAEEASRLIQTATDFVKEVTLEDILLNRRSYQVSMLSRSSLEDLGTLRNYLHSLIDLNRLISVAAYTHPSQFLTVLEAELQPRHDETRSKGIGAYQPGSHLPHWTLSNHFPHLVAAAADRVYEIKGTSTSDGGFRCTRLKPALESLVHQRMEIMAAETRRFVRAQLGKSRGNQRSMIIVVKTEKGMQSTIHRLLSSRQHYTAAEFNRFLLHYQRRAQKGMSYGDGTTLVKHGSPEKKPADHHAQFQDDDDIGDLHLDAELQDDFDVGEDDIPKPTQSEGPREVIVPSTVHELLMSLEPLPETDDFDLTIRTPTPPTSVGGATQGTAMSAIHVDSDDDAVEVLDSEGLEIVGSATEEERFRRTVNSQLVSIDQTFGVLQFAAEAEAQRIVHVIVLTHSEAVPHHILPLIHGFPTVIGGHHQAQSKAAEIVASPVGELLLMDYNLETLRSLEVVTALLASQWSHVDLSVKALFEETLADVFEAIVIDAVASTTRKPVDFTRASVAFRLSEEREAFHEIVRTKGMLTAQMFADNYSRLEAAREL